MTSTGRGYKAAALHFGVGRADVERLMRTSSSADTELIRVRMGRAEIEAVRARAREVGMDAEGWILEVVRWGLSRTGG